ncbi:predicted protein, partial [Nematostella vectensis]
ELDTRKLVSQQNKKKKKSGGFQSLGLSFPVFKGVMKKGYKVPTPIQRKTLPLVMDGKDVVAMARTGSGKTAAFLIPMFEKLQTHTAKVGIRALILSPTRELALQTQKFIKELGRFTGLKSSVILGGDSLEGQFAAIHTNPDIVVATPGRFLHVVMEMELKLSSVEYVVFDEADRLFEMGFAEQLHEIIHRLPESRQTLLFSATLPRLLVDFAKAGLCDPALVRLDVDTKLSEQLKVSDYVFSLELYTALMHLLQNVIKPTEQTLIFAATKHHVEYLKEMLLSGGIDCSYVYSSLDQTARTINVGKFQHKKTMVMVVTDVAARGIDIPMLDNVINFHFPPKAKLFVHRVGRVARAGRSGTAYSLVANDEVAHLLDLHLFLGRPLRLSATGSQEEDGVFGGMPQQVLDEEDATLRTIHDNSHDLMTLQGVCANAYKQYIRSRPQASSESVKRSKELMATPLAVHPLLGSEVTDVPLSQLIDSVRNFKPRQTIFEVNPTSKTSARDVMKSKRAQHGNTIEKVHSLKQQQQPYIEKTHTSPEGENVDMDDADVKGLFATIIDPSENKKRKPKRNGMLMYSRHLRSTIVNYENYISHTSSDHYAERGLGLGLNSFEKEATGAVIDIVGDDDETLRKKKGLKKWDRKRKRFVGEEGNKKKIRTESGARIPASYKRNIYKDWVKRNKLDTPGADLDEGGGKRGKKGL